MELNREGSGVGCLRAVRGRARLVLAKFDLACCIRIRRSSCGLGRLVNLGRW